MPIPSTSRPARRVDEEPERGPQSRAEAVHIVKTTAEFVIALSENPGLVRRLLDEHRVAADVCAFGAAVREPCIVQASARAAQRYLFADALLRLSDDGSGADLVPELSFARSPRT